jgi:hypothetical protein
VSDQDEGQQPAAKTGEAAWKEARSRVAEKNDRARKAGKERREAYERARLEARRAAEARRREELLKRTGS